MRTGVAALAWWCSAWLGGCEAPNPRLMYADPQFGFVLTIPDSGWTLTDETGMPQVLVIAKADSPTGGFVPNVTIAVEPILGMMTAADYLARAVGPLAQDGLRVETPRIRVAHRTEYGELTAWCDSCDPPLSVLMRAIVKDRHAFVATATVPEDQARPTAACISILDSWRFR